ncbi:hypothetical protein B0H17DRAFT_1339713 [Mycena rosella]|uniref:Uncharacterized protein n=1 Tax=Mycena rosella TaxID=1033263 RepID=A0AAD7BY47_MYCRO|nr:hypothetical protein B0H17DRAFT_1339713 [Mycena rosella]
MLPAPPHKGRLHLSAHSLKECPLAVDQPSPPYCRNRRRCAPQRAPLNARGASDVYATSFPWVSSSGHRRELQIRARPRQPRRLRAVRPRSRSRDPSSVKLDPVRCRASMFPHPSSPAVGARTCTRFWRLPLRTSSRPPPSTSEPRRLGPRRARRRRRSAKS